MKKWNFIVKNNSQEVIKKLNSVLGSNNGFDFMIDDTNNESITFIVRKRILLAYQIILRNHIIVKGKIQKAETENETNVEISFNQHFFTIFYIYAFLISGLFIIILSVISNTALYMLGGIFLIIGIAFWIGLQKKFKKDIQNYQTLISDILLS